MYSTLKYNKNNLLNLFKKTKNDANLIQTFNWNSKLENEFIKYIESICDYQKNISFSSYNHYFYQIISTIESTYFFKNKNIDLNMFDLVKKEIKVQNKQDFNYDVYLLAKIFKDLQTNVLESLYYNNASNVEYWISNLDNNAFFNCLNENNYKNQKEKSFEINIQNKEFLEQNIKFFEDILFDSKKWNIEYGFFFNPYHIINLIILMYGIFKYNVYSEYSRNVVILLFQYMDVICAKLGTPVMSFSKIVHQNRTLINETIEKIKNNLISIEEFTEIVLTLKNKEFDKMKNLYWYILDGFKRIENNSKASKFFNFSIVPKLSIAKNIYLTDVDFCEMFNIDYDTFIENYNKYSIFGFECIFYEKDLLCFVNKHLVPILKTNCNDEIYKNWIKNTKTDYPINRKMLS